MLASSFSLKVHHLEEIPALRQQDLKDYIDEIVSQKISSMNLGELEGFINMLRSKLVESLKLSKQIGTQPVSNPVLIAIFD